MILLMAFAFLAGVVTILSPCILPILPIVLSSTIGGKETGRSRPLGVVIGFVLSFTFFTLFLSTIVRFSGIPADSLRFLSIIIIAGFGISLLIPQFQKLMEIIFSKLAGFVPQGSTKTGFWAGFVIGLSLGLLWTPCVGPILASVISLAITGSVTLDAIFITLAYSLGTAIPMFLIMLGGQKMLHKVPWLLTHTAAIQKGFGVIMILTAIGIFYNIDRSFQTYILKTFPQYGVGLTQFEEVDAVRERLNQINGSDKKEDMGKPMFELLEGTGPMAPEIISGGEWFNLPASDKDSLTMKDLRGKVVLIDFWTYSCINCQRTFPYLRKWHDTYGDKGLVIVGVHSPEFEFEKDSDNVRQAIKDFDLRYPIVQDNNFATWRAYENHYWPAKYLIDKDGQIRYTHFGEGAYDETEKVIQELLKETGQTDLPTATDNTEYDNYARTPETYLGYGRIDRFVSPEKIIPDEKEHYTSPDTLPFNGIAFSGQWKVTREYANPQKDASLLLNFESKEVFLVMRPVGGTPAKVTVYLDGEMQDLGRSVVNGKVTVDSDRLYKLINLPTPGRHILRLEFEDSNVEVYAFTFG